MEPNRSNRIYLKVKVCSLAAEARLIRREERRSRTHRMGLAEHRRGPVRREARSALLAYGFLRGRQYLQLEAKVHTKPDWRRVEELVSRYGAVQDLELEAGKEFAARKGEEAEGFKKWRSELS